MRETVRSEPPHLNQKRRKNTSSESYVDIVGKEDRKRRKNRAQCSLLLANRQRVIRTKTQSLTRRFSCCCTFFVVDELSRRKGLFAAE